jgi:dephospho-CoA kinase
MTRRLRIGLTGGIASGKSTAAARFKELGVPVIDADEAARVVVQPDQPGFSAVIERFGRGMLAANGELDRRALRDLIFADAAARRDLERMLHPLIRDEMQRGAAKAAGPYVVMAIPLLVEGGSGDRVDRTLVIDADEQIQLERLIARDQSSVEQVRAILRAQASRTERLKAADDIIVNSGSVTDLHRAVDELHARYLAMAVQ